MGTGDEPSEVDDAAGEAVELRDDERRRITLLDGLERSHEAGTAAQALPTSCSGLMDRHELPSATFGLGNDRGTLSSKPSAGIGLVGSN